MAEITKSRACIDQTKGMLMLIYGIEDDAYLNAKAAHNIHSVVGPADLVRIGHHVCELLSPSVSPAMVTDDVYRAWPYGAGSSPARSAGPTPRLPIARRAFWSITRPAPTARAARALSTAMLNIDGRRLALLGATG